MPFTAVRLSLMFLDLHISIQDKVITFLDELSDEALKKEATSEAKSDTFSTIMKVRISVVIASHGPIPCVHVCLEYYFHTYLFYDCVVSASSLSEGPS